MTKKKAKELVKKRLWSWGYSVRDMDGVPGIKYDLLCEGKYRMIVATFDTEPAAFGKWEDQDVMAAVSDDEAIHYSSEKHEPTPRPQDVMHLQK